MRAKRSSRKACKKSVMQSHNDSRKLQCHNNCMTSDTKIDTCGNSTQRNINSIHWLEVGEGN